MLEVLRSLTAVALTTVGIIIIIVDYARRGRGGAAQAPTLFDLAGTAGVLLTAGK